MLRHLLATLVITSVVSAAVPAACSNLALTVNPTSGLFSAFKLFNAYVVNNGGGDGSACPVDVYFANSKCPYYGSSPPRSTGSYIPGPDNGNGIAIPAGYSAVWDAPANNANYGAGQYVVSLVYRGGGSFTTISSQTLNYVPTCTVTVTSPKDGTFLSGPNPSLAFSGHVNNVACEQIGCRFDLSAVASPPINSAGQFSGTMGSQALAFVNKPISAHTFTCSSFKANAVNANNNAITIYLGNQCSITINQPSAVYRTNTQTFSGSVGPLCTAVTVQINGNTADIITANNGIWTSSLRLTDGSYTLTAISSSPAYPQIQSGGSTAAVVVNTKPCAAPTITSPASGSTIYSNSPAILSGTTGTNCPTVGIFVGLYRIATVTASGGSWQYDSSFGPGSYSVTAVADGPGGIATSPASSAVSFRLRKPCVPPTITTPTDGQIFYTHNPVISGTADVNCPNIEVITNFGVTNYATVNAAGVWSFTAAGSGYGDSNGWVMLANSTSTTGYPEADSGNVAFSIAADPCNAPNLAQGVLPIPADVNKPTFTANIDSRCLSTSFTVSSGSTAVIQANPIPVDGVLTYTVSQPLAYGTYTAQICSSDSAAPARNKGCLPFTFVISQSACPAPIITRPQNGLTYYGTYPTLNFATVAGCTTILRCTGSSASTCTQTFVTATNYEASSNTYQGSAQLSFLGVPDGPAAFYFAAIGPNGGKPLSTLKTFNAVLAFSACSLPTVTSPADGATVRTSTPTIIGTDTNGGVVQCVNSIIIRFNGNTIVAPITTVSRKRGSARSFSYTFTQPLADGVYSYAVYPNQQVGTTGSTNSYPVGNPTTRTFTVNTQPQPTVGMGGSRRKRMNRCLPEQDRCPITSPDGYLAYECVEDLESNVERCGSCDGPDCRTIPHANKVLCVEGTCEVLSCETGHSLVRNSCESNVHV